MAEVKTGFKTPPEVTSYFEGKGLKPGFSWLDVWGEEHAHAFTVAKATELELLTTFKTSIAGALRDGKGFDTWREEIRKELAKSGWLQPRMVKDPTGQKPDQKVDFSSDRRLKTIFWSNMNSARSAGQWERAQRSKGALPYILYVRTTATDPRQQHLAWAGTILPVEDPFWNTHWPPNGWGCKCTVRQIGNPERDRLVGTEMKGGGTYTKEAPPIETKTFVNKRTGEVTEVPVGIDPGWQINPGKARTTTLIQNLETRLAAADQNDATKAIEKLWEDPFLKIAPKLPERSWLPAGVSQPLSETLGAKSPVVSIPNNVIAERLDRHGMAIEDFAVLPSMIEQATVLPDPDGSPKVRSLLYRVGKTWWRAFVTVSENGFLRVNSLHQRDAKQVRKQFEKAGAAWKE